LSIPFTYVLPLKSAPENVGSDSRIKQHPNSLIPTIIRPSSLSPRSLLAGHHVKWLQVGLLAQLALGCPSHIGHGVHQLRGIPGFSHQLVTEDDPMSSLHFDGHLVILDVKQ